MGYEMPGTFNDADYVLRQLGFRQSRLWRNPTKQYQTSQIAERIEYTNGDGFVVITLEKPTERFFVYINDVTFNTHLAIVDGLNLHQV
jgi:hypothetical protein